MAAERTPSNMTTGKASTSYAIYGGVQKEKRKTISHPCHDMAMGLIPFIGERRFQLFVHGSHSYADGLELRVLIRRCKGVEIILMQHTCVIPRLTRSKWMQSEGED